MCREVERGEAETSKFTVERSICRATNYEALAVRLSAGHQHEVLHGMALQQPCSSRGCWRHIAYRLEQFISRLSSSIVSSAFASGMLAAHLSGH